MSSTTTRNNNILLRLDFPFYLAEGETEASGQKTEAFRRALRAVSFSATEGLNRLYAVEVAFYLPDAVNPEGGAAAFLGLKAALRVENRTGEGDFDIPGTATASGAEYVDGARRMYFGVTAECDYLGRFDRNANDGHHFYRVVIRPTLDQARFNHPIRTYMNAMGEGGAFTYKDAIGKALTAYNDSADAKYYGGKSAGGQSEDGGRPGRDPVKFDLSGIDAADKLTLSPRWAVQYEESYYDFVLRVLERQGWHYSFSFEDSEKLVFEDEKFDPADPAQLLRYVPENVLMRSGPKLRKLGVKTTQFVDYQTQTASGLGISGKLEKRRMPVTQVTVKDYDPNRPQLAVTATYPKTDESARPNAVVVENEFFDVPGDAEKVAQIRYEELSGREASYAVTANLPGAQPGLTFVLGSEIPEARRSDPARAWAGEPGGAARYFIIGAEHRGVAGNIEAFVRETLVEMLRDDETGTAPDLKPGYAVRLSCVPFSDHYRPPRTLPWNRMAGTVSATTLSLKSGADDEVAVLNDGRYFIKFKGSCTAATDGGGGAEGELVAGEDGSVGPLRMQSPMAARMAGTSYYLNAGTEVLVTFVGGNPERPLILGPVPNPDTAKMVMSNMVETALDGGLGTRLAMDSKTASSYYGVGMSGDDLQKLIVSGAAAYSSLSSTFANSSALALNGSAFGLSSSYAGAFNATGVAAGFGVPALATLLGDLLSIGNQSMAIDNKRNAKAEAKRTEERTPEEQEEYDAKQAERNADMQTTKMAFNKTPVLVGMLQLIMAIGGFQKQPSRVMINADAESSVVSYRGSPVTAASKTMMIVNYATKIVEDVLVLYNNMTDRQAANEKSKELSQDGEGMFYQEDSYHHAVMGIDCTTLLLEALVYVKIMVASLVQGTGNNGIRILASAAQPDTNVGSILKKQAMNFLTGLTWSKTNPTSKFTPNTTGSNGMDIKIAADGHVDVTSATKVMVGGVPPDNSGDNPGSYIQLERGATRQEASLAMSSHQIAMRATDSLIGLANGGVEFHAAPEQAGTAYARATLGSSGDVSLSGSNAGSLTFGGATTISSGGVMMQTADNFILGVKSATGGLVMGYYDANNAQVSGKPYISLGLTPTNGPSILGKIKARDDKRKECDDKAKELETARQEVVDIQAKQAKVRGDETADPTAVVPQTSLAAQLTAALLKVGTLKSELTALKGQLAPLVTAVDNEPISVTQQKAALVNGTDGSERIEAGPSAVLVESGTSVTVRMGEKGSIVVDNNGVMLKGGSVKATIDGTTGMVKLA